MLTLSIECSGTAGSIALHNNLPQFAEPDEIAYLELKDGIGSVQTLAPAINELVQVYLTGSPGQPDQIAVTMGPGSFTGLRVGLSTAKMLSFAWQIPLVGVDTLHAIALRAAEAVASSAQPELSSTIFLPVINAFRGQVFTCAIRFVELQGVPSARKRLRVERLSQSVVIDAKLWCNAPLQSLRESLPTELHFTETRTILCGPGLEVFQANDPQCETLPSSLWQPTAREVYRVALDSANVCQLSSAEQLMPNYIRASAAEEKMKTSVAEEKSRR